jgi:hypothetical protein
MCRGREEDTSQALVNLAQGQAIVKNIDVFAK